MEASYDQVRQTARLRTSLNWMIAFASGSTLVYIIVAAIFALPSIGFLALLVALATGILIWLRRLLGQRSLATIAVALAVVIIVLAIGLSGLLPILLPGIGSTLLIAVVQALPYISSVVLRRLSLVAGAAAALTAVLATYLSLFAPLPPLVAHILTIFVTPMTVAICLVLLWQFHARLTDALKQTQTANSALLQAQTGLEQQVAERTAALQVALTDVETRAAEQARLLAENEQQREAIREMSVPVLPVNRDTLVMPLVGALDSARLVQIQEQALSRLEATRARCLLLDITGVPVVDSQVAQGLVRVVQAAQLLGAEVALIGIRPEVAQTIVGLGLDLSSITTYSDLQGALRHRGEKR